MKFSILKFPLCFIISRDIYGICLKIQLQSLPSFSSSVVVFQSQHKNVPSYGLFLIVFSEYTTCGDVLWFNLTILFGILKILFCFDFMQETICTL